MLPKMTDIEIVQRTIAQLQDKKDRVAQRSTAISAERQSLGFDVHANDDKAARAKLDKLNAEAATLAGELESIRGALVEADKRLVAAQQVAANEAAKANAAEIRKLLAVFATVARDMDEALADFATRTVPTQLRSRSRRHPPLLHRRYDNKSPPVAQASPAPCPQDRSSLLWHQDPAAQTIDQMRTQKPGAARHQNAFATIVDSWHVNYPVLSVRAQPRPQACARRRLFRFPLGFALYLY
jgi:hypothetical protein